MALTEVPGDIEGATGTVETIQIVPGQQGYVLTITQVFYGTNANGPLPVALNADGKSFNLKLISGNNLLQVTLFSPNQIDGSAVAQQTISGQINILEDDIEFVSGVAIWNPEIVGK